jgi:peptide deformylase
MAANDIPSTAMGEVPGFAADLASRREQRGLTMTSLAEQMGFDRSYVSHVEHGRHPASADFARRADAALSAGGALWRSWQQDVDRPGSAGVQVTRVNTMGLLVEDDHAELRYADGFYRATQRRQLFNAGTEPVTRYLMRISVDRYPGDPERSNRLYRERPLRLDQLGLTATCDGEEMAWQVKFDRDAFKEIWLLFENARGKFPLYPGQRATLAYSYAVDDGRWGPWFQRAVRLPTGHLSVRLVFPSEARPAVWGTETSTTAEAVPLRTPIAHHRDGTTDAYEWSTDDPPMGARYRLEWRFRADEIADEAAGPDLRTSSDRMRAAGIVQHGDPVLRRTADPFNLPREAARAREVIDGLFAAIQRVSEHHVFGKGMGLAAPQIGIPRAAAIVRPPGDDADPIVLLNPRLIAETGETDEQYEGCLSFFDVRGLVPRPRRLEIEHTNLDGDRAITAFTDGLARLVGHEVDHLYGKLYTDRMREGVRPIPVEEYRGIGQSWTYS